MPWKGPAELTVFHPDVFAAIDGLRSQCVKSEWYDIMYPYPSLVTSRVRARHAARRRQWNRGFSPKALQYHEAKNLQHLARLDACIEADARAGRPSDVDELFVWFGFDIMGDFVFSRSFGMLREQGWHAVIARLKRALRFLGPLSPAPWLVQMGFRMYPRVWPIKDWFDTADWAEEQVRERLDAREKPQLPDLMYYLMEQDGDQPMADSQSWLKADSLLAIVAGRHGHSF